VGPNSAAIARLAGERVRVVGEVRSVRDAYQDAAVVVVPLLHGSGARLKIIEAFAHGRPVVSTPVGARGIAARAGEHLLLAVDAPSFAAAVVSAAEPSVAASLVARARRLVASTYDAAVVSTAAGDLLERVIAASPAT
jgi:glycosyltransferase involved in cell wall biosynthesis